MSGCLKYLVIAAILLPPCTAAAQGNADLKRLDAMVGRWRVDVDLKATPLTQAAKASGTEECEWFADRHVVCRSEAKGPAGSYSQMRTFSYTPARKEYAVYAVDSLRSEEHTSELQSQSNLVCRLLLEKKKKHK